MTHQEEDMKLYNSLKLPRKVVEMQKKKKSLKQKLLIS